MSGSGSQIPEYSNDRISHATDGTAMNLNATANVAGSEQGEAISVRSFGRGPTTAWINTGLEVGSEIPVSSNESRQGFWIWETSSATAQNTSWSFKPSRDSNLYISASNDLESITMQTEPSRTYFTVSVGVRGGVVIQFDETRYIGQRDGKLVLTEVKTEWSIIMERELASMGAKKYVVIIEEELVGRRWIAEDLVPNSSIPVDYTVQDDKRSHWLGEFHLDISAWRFQPRLQPNLYVAANSRGGDVSLQSANALDGSGNVFEILSSFMQDKNGGYVSIEPETSLLTSTTSRTVASAWKHIVYRYELNGLFFPSEDISARPTGPKSCHDNCHALPICKQTSGTKN